MLVGLIVHAVINSLQCSDNIGRNNSGMPVIRGQAYVNKQHLQQLFTALCIVDYALIAENNNHEVHVVPCCN